MAGIFDRVGALAGTELAKAADLAHHTFQDRMGVHRHTGRALVETVAEVCREHPNIVGVGAGLLVEQLLVHEKERHDARLAARTAALEAEDAAPGPPPPFGPVDGEPVVLNQAPNEDAPALQPQPSPPAIRNAHIPHDFLTLGRLSPRKAAAEVFGALLLLKLARTGAKMFRHRRQGEVWFAPAARIRLFSGSIAAYNLVAAIRSPKISAWRNGAILFFGTDALKPILKAPRRPR